MAVPSISFYAASPPSTICSIDNQFQINSHASSDYDLNSRPPPPTKKPIVGGLSCLFSSSSVKHSSSSPSVKHSSSSGISSDDDLSSSYSYSNTFSLSSTFKCRDQSPVTVFDYPVSCSSSRCSSLRTTHDFNDNSGLQRSVKNNSESIFHGFVQNASGSCMDCDLSSFSVNMDSSMDYSDELTFDLEDNVNEGNSNLHTRELLKEAQSRHKIFYDEFVIKAFYEAERAHEGQMRASGDPYLQHCVETGVLLAMIGANSTVVTAGLLHDTLDDSSIDRDYIFHEFGADVVNLIEGVSKLSHLSKLARDNNTANRTDEADRLHTMFLAMADARAVLIKLADRLHNMMTLEALPMVKQQRFAKETLEIFVPLANRLGISTWKEQLENMCFKYLYPKEYQNLSTKLARSNVDVPITCAVEKLEQALKDQDIQYHALSGRCKSLYSIYSKMIKKRIAIDEIHDIHGLRLIVDEKEDCYKALDIVHSLWPVVPGKFKDYINYPKFNGYQSLHTVVMGQDMVPLEVQIRTKEMHLQAEFGFASHWRYKEGDCRHSSYVTQMVEWARWVITWQCETASRDLYSKVADHQQFRLPCPFPSHLDDCPYSQVPEFDQNGPVFVIMIQNDKMSVQEFPPNSTVADLLERVGYSTTSRLSSSYGLPVKEELKPRLNHELVTNPQCKLKMGDMMELTTTIPAKSLTEYRKEIQRMYNHGLTVSTMSGWS